MKKTIAMILALVLAVGSCFALTGCGGGSSADGGEVRVYCFGDYIDPVLIDEFEAATGVSVIMDVFDTNEEMYPVIKNQSVEYDVICASDYMIEKLIEEELLAELNKDNLPNLENMSEKYMEVCTAFDEGNKYAVPHTWGTMGILYNTEVIKEGSITSWNDLWNKEYEQQIVMPDSMRDTMAIALKAKGYSLNTTSEKEIAEAADYLIEQKPLVYKYANDSARDLLLSGSANLAVVWNGEVLYCQEDNPNLAFCVPKEGSEEFVDAWAIPAAAKNKDNAEKWINFMLDRDVAVTNFEYLTYSIPNNAVIEMNQDNAANMEVLFPEDNILTKCEALKSLGSEADDMYTEYWKQFKS